MVFDARALIVLRCFFACMAYRTAGLMFIDGVHMGIGKKLSKKHDAAWDYNSIIVRIKIVCRIRRQDVLMAHYSLVYGAL
jgi:hypothetical protein